MKHVLILLFALGITMAATTTVLAQDADESPGSAGSVEECRPLLTPEGAEPDYTTCSETYAGITGKANQPIAYQGDRNDVTAATKENLARVAQILKDDKDSTKDATGGKGSESDQ